MEEIWRSRNMREERKETHKGRRENRKRVRRAMGDRERHRHRVRDGLGLRDTQTDNDMEDVCVCVCVLCVCTDAGPSITGELEAVRAFAVERSGLIAADGVTATDLRSIPALVNIYEREGGRDREREREIEGREGEI